MSSMQPRPNILLKSLCFLVGFTMHIFWPMMFNTARAQGFDTTQVEKPLSRHKIIQRSLRPHAQKHPALTDAPKYRIEVELDLDLFIYRGTS